MSHTIPLTRESFEALQEELKRLIREERPKVIQDIAEARAHGDLSENAEYDAAKNRQEVIDLLIFCKKQSIIAVPHSGVNYYVPWLYKLAYQLVRYM